MPHPRFHKYRLRRTDHLFRSAEKVLSDARGSNPTVNVIVKDPDILGGTAVFCGTRVPIQTLFDYLEGGETLEDFLEGFPAVTRESAVAVLEQAKHLLLARR